jgi:hypothetical protein
VNPIIHLTSSKASATVVADSSYLNISPAAIFKGLPRSIQEDGDFEVYKERLVRKFNFQDI